MAKKEETNKNIAHNSYIEKCNTDSKEIKGARSTLTTQQDTSVTDSQADRSQLKQLGEVKNVLLTGEAKNVPGRKQGERIPGNSTNRSDRKTSSRKQSRRREFIPANSELSPSSQPENQSSPPALNHRGEHADPKRASFGGDNDNHDSIPKSVEPCDKSRLTFTPESVVSDCHATATSPENPSPIEAPTPSSTVSTAPLSTEDSVASEQGSQETSQVVIDDEEEEETSLGSSGSTLPGSSSTSHLNVEGLSSEANGQTRKNNELEDEAGNTNSENDENEVSSERQRSTQCQSPPIAASRDASPALTSPLSPQPEGAAKGIETETGKPRSSHRSPSRGEEGSKEAAKGIETETGKPRSSHRSPSRGEEESKEAARGIETESGKPRSSHRSPSRGGEGSEEVARGIETESGKPRSSQRSPSGGGEGSEKAARGIESDRQPPFQRPASNCLGCGCQPWECSHSDPLSLFHHNDPSQASPRLSPSLSPGEVQPEGADGGGVDTENQHSAHSRPFVCPADPAPFHHVSAPPVLSFPCQCFSNGGPESDQRRQHGRKLGRGLQLRSHVALDGIENPEEDDRFFSVRRGSRHPEIRAVTHLTFRPADQEEMANNDANGEANTSIQEQRLTERGSRVTISHLTMAFNWGDNTRRTCLRCLLPVDVRLVDCYHAVLCRSCANLLVRCPICAADIVAISPLNH